MQSRAAQRYAKAILSFALDKDAAAAVDTDMRSIHTTVSDSKELRDFLSSPVIQTAKKKDALTAVFSKINGVTQGAFDLLATNKRLEILDQVAASYIAMYDEHNKKNVARVTTAVALTPQLEKKILAKVQELTGNEVKLENTIDPSIVGGFILRVGDMQYDASVAGKLRNLEQKFQS